MRHGHNCSVRHKLIRRATPATGCGGIKTCPQQSRNANYRTIPHFAVSLRHDNNCSGNGSSISPACRHNTNCRCSIAWRLGSI